MHKIQFYPVGNGDTSQIVLKNGRRILFDFHHHKYAEERLGSEIDLKKRLQAELSLAGRTSFDVVAFTHGDKDHIKGSTEFFELRYAKKYQGEDRVKIDELWVPAAMVLESATNDEQSDEFVLWRQEARHRLKEGKGIRVFSRPDKLEVWLRENNLTVESRRHLITDAGETVPGFTLPSDGVEFFCHSPFIKHVDEGDDLRNPAALIFNVRFNVDGSIFDYLAIGDTEWEVLEDIVRITQYHGREDRLMWDIFNVPHHCSYLALSDEKGDRETEPKPKIKELLLNGREGAYLVSSSHAIEDTREAREQKMPPHIQARKCYESYLDRVRGARFLVTMEESPAGNPTPLVFKIERGGIIREKEIRSAPAIITSTTAPRAG